MHGWQASHMWPARCHCIAGNNILPFPSACKRFSSTNTLILLKKLYKKNLLNICVSFIYWFHMTPDKLRRVHNQYNSRIICNIDTIYEKISGRFSRTADLETLFDCLVQEWNKG
jgi:hypothetical protein